jgi:hypothetical protein
MGGGESLALQGATRLTCLKSSVRESTTVWLVRILLTFTLKSWVELSMPNCRSGQGVGFVQGNAMSQSWAIKVNVNPSQSFPPNTPCQLHRHPRSAWRQYRQIFGSRQKSQIQTTSFATVIEEQTVRNRDCKVSISNIAHRFGMQDTEAF